MDYKWFFTKSCVDQIFNSRKSSLENLSFLSFFTIVRIESTMFVLYRRVKLQDRVIFFLEYFFSTKKESYCKKLKKTRHWRFLDPRYFFQSRILKNP